MSTAALSEPFEGIDEATYKRRQRAWALYDWANSAFATTILAAVMPAYYSGVAGATLPSEATATGYWSASLAISLFIVALLSPILGTISDVVRGKKKLLSLFAGLGIVATGLMVFVGTGDWLLASLLFVLGRIGFSASIIFYDALLPHVAKPEDLDRLSTTGYALGYLGGGLLLAVNIVMIFVLGSEAGARLSFLSVAVWWAIFTVPLLREVPEPPSAAVKKAGMGLAEVVRVSFARLRNTFRELRQYRELFKFLIAFLIYNDGIGTIIGLAVIYGAELGFGMLELVGALLMVQFVGIPFSFVFGRIPYRDEPRRALFLAFILWNIVALPLVAFAGRAVLPDNIIGARQPDYETVGEFVGTGVYDATDEQVVQLGLLSGEGDITPVRMIRATEDIWFQEKVSEAKFEGEALTYIYSESPDAAYAITYNGRGVSLFYAKGPDRGIFRVYLDGKPYDFDEGGDLEVGEVDAYQHGGVRWNYRLVVEAEEDGKHTLIVRNTGKKNPKAKGTRMDLGRVEVLPPPRQSNLFVVIGLLLVVEALGAAFAWKVGERLVQPLADLLNTKYTVLLALLAYTVVAIWGYFLDTVIGFWMLAWLVAVVQGGSQALSRSLYASMSPRAKSGEFFGFFSVMEKFAGILGPAIFALVVAIFDNSRPAILSLIVLFIVGGWLLWRVDEKEGQRVAREEDEAWLRSGGAEA